MADPSPRVKFANGSFIAYRLITYAELFGWWLMHRLDWIAVPTLVVLAAATLVAHVSREATYDRKDQ